LQFPFTLELFWRIFALVLAHMCSGNSLQRIIILFWILPKIIARCTMKQGADQKIKSAYDK